MILHLKPGRDTATRRRHPWLFSGGVARREGSDTEGSGLVTAVAADGSFLARGFSSPSSPIVARWWTFEDRPLDAELVAARVLDAVALRRRLVSSDTDGYRVINAEGDFLPGLVVDRYGSTLVVQATTEGTERARPLWLPPLAAAFPGSVIFQKNDLSTRLAEGLGTKDELLAGEAIPPHAQFLEHGLRYSADIASGQKTGFFLDQRENRALVRAISPGKRVLNLFCYSGAFGVAALAGGATYVAQVDSSGPALIAARENHLLNEQPVDGADARVAFVAADVFTDLRDRVARRERWDVIVTDPPAFAKRAPDVERACRGYKDINRLAMMLLAPGGTLLACSCSGPVDAVLFQKVLFGASVDARVPLRLLERRGAGLDHPVSIDCPEGEYLKAFRLER
ncbi:MAG: class I SAM-dependent rRNA methyltransferase [Thermoanaerobaculia bacterium]